jgi:hypothetical protein
MTKPNRKKGGGMPERDLFWDSSDEREFAQEQDSSVDQSDIDQKPAARKKPNNATETNISKQ